MMAIGTALEERLLVKRRNGRRSARIIKMKRDGLVFSYKEALIIEEQMETKWQLKQKELLANKERTELGLKRCSRCGIVKPLSEFGIYTYTGIPRACCKKCFNAAVYKSREKQDPECRREVVKKAQLRYTARKKASLQNATDDGHHNTSNINSLVDSVDINSCLTNSLELDSSSIFPELWKKKKNRDARRDLRISRLVAHGLSTEDANDAEALLEAEYSTEKSNFSLGLRRCAFCYKPKTLNKYREYYDGGHSTFHVCNECVSTYTRTIKYKVSSEELAEAIKESGGKCNICGEDYGEKFECDHDHTIGMFRGVLCHRCNTLLGKYETALRSIDAVEKYYTMPQVEPLMFDWDSVLRRIDGGKMRHCLMVKARIGSVRRGVTSYQELGLVLAVWVRSKGRCEICGKRVCLYKEYGHKFAHFDHDHSSGQLRGVLCPGCNTMLGGYDWARNLNGMVEYYLGLYGVDEADGFLAAAVARIKQKNTAFHKSLDRVDS